MKIQFVAGSLTVILFAAGCQESNETTPSPANEKSAEGNPLTAPVDYLGAVGQAKRLAEKTIDLAALNNAIQLFNAQEERLPKSLNELVANRYIPSLPTAPPGMRIEYNPQTGTVRMVKQP